MRDCSQSLPPELWTRVFSFTPYRKDVASCRLTCKNFYDLASPFLITRVVFALRLDTITRLRDVIHHPFYSRYVTDLIYDSSRYDRELAQMWDEYVKHCNHTERRLVDKEGAERVREEEKQFHALSNDGSVATVAPTAPPSPYRRTTMNSLTRRWCGSDDECMSTGCHKGYINYCRRYEIQGDLEKKGIPLQVLVETFTKLPSLRNIFFTDFRSVVEFGESYQGMCDRLFGCTVEPYHGPHEHDLLLIEEAATVASRRIHSFSTGVHPFSTSIAVMNKDCYSLQQTEVFRPERFSSQELDRLSGMFKNLRVLKLFYNKANGTAPGAAIPTRLVASCSSSLRRLTIAPVGTDGRASPIASNEYGYNFLELHFPFLVYVEFRHLRLKGITSIQAFLDKHAKTLREVRLIEYCMVYDAEEEDRLAKWAGETLHLAGVEIVTAADLVALAVGTKELSDLEYNEIFRGPRRRPVLIPDDAGDFSPMEAIQARESIWLDGRGNALDRTVEFPETARWAMVLPGWIDQPIQPV